MKFASTIFMIGISCLSLGYLMPKFMYNYRNQQQNGKKDFHVRAEYEKQLKEQNNFKYTV